MTSPEHSPLGQTTVFPHGYDAGLLFPIPRAPQRASLAVPGRLPFHGEDLWTAFELSWLDARGKPLIGIAEFAVPAHSPCLIESKSWKLYLNGFASERYASVAELAAVLRRDLSAAAGAKVEATLYAPRQFPIALAGLPGVCIDALPIDIDCYGPPQPDFLAADSDSAVTECLVSHLLKSNCPVTGQPDWASVQIAYSGPRIEHAGLLRYLISYRQHSDFHEHCVERIFCDVLSRCSPQRLSVYARYTRRGGIDINPFRSSDPLARAPRLREPRQ